MAKTSLKPITVVPMRLRDLVRLFKSKSSERRLTKPSKKMGLKVVYALTERPQRP